MIFAALVNDAPEAEWLEVLEICERMEKLGFHMTLGSPFIPGDPWFVDFTPHGATPKRPMAAHFGSGYTPLEAAREAARKVERGLQS
ncbi:MAG: hypothetical protein O7A04_09355 [Acidobacteria bacterium]|nr:hypothetical protein [Acidobacteriota bacterium]